MIFKAIKFYQNVITLIQINSNCNTHYNVNLAPCSFNRFSLSVFLWIFVCHVKPFMFSCIINSYFGKRLIKTDTNLSQNQVAFTIFNLYSLCYRFTLMRLRIPRGYSMDIQPQIVKDHTLLLCRHFSASNVNIYC